MNVFSMDYPAWPTELTRDAKLKQFVIKSHYNVSQHLKWKPCDSWLNLKEGSWKAALFARSCFVLKWFLPGAMPGLPSLSQILPLPFVFQCWAGQQEEQQGEGGGWLLSLLAAMGARTGWELRLSGHMQFCILEGGYDSRTKSHSVLQRDKCRVNLT